MRLTLLYAAMIALSGSAVAALIIFLSLTPLDNQSAKSEPTDVKTGAAVTKKITPEDRAAANAADAVKQQARAEWRDRMITSAVIGVGALTLLSAGLGWWVAGRVLRPVHTVSNTARRLSEQNLHERIAVSGPHDEMRELAETFNGMLARLQRSFDAQSHFAANASHELRGPMTTQRTLVEVAAGTPGASADLRELADALRPVLGRQERLVDGLLALAWSEHGTSSVEQLRLDELVRTSVARTEHPNVEATLQPTTVAGDPILLDLLVDNLIRNAARHNVDGGRIWISVEPWVLTVENTGAPITAERLDDLVEAFRSGSRDRTGGGVGLGLAIVTAVARAHRTQLTLTPREGGGIRAEVRFTPAAAATRAGDGPPRRTGRRSAAMSPSPSP
jgi:signal transduction histidine kinase